MYQSPRITVEKLADGIAKFTFNAEGSVNKFDQQTLADCKAALEQLQQDKSVTGVLFTSGKDNFIVGADITEFLPIFQRDEQELIPWIKQASDVFDLCEDLPVPTVVAISGFALGGGCEWTLACDYRVGDSSTKIGLPEVKLGLMPGFGGTVRLPRIIGADNAMEWITTGKDRNAVKAQQEGLIDAVTTPDKLETVALSMLKDAIAGKLDWQKKRAVKLQPLKLNKTEATMSFTTAKGMVFATAGKHYPAPMVAVQTIEAAAGLDRAGAMALENQGFAKLAKTDAATAQIGLFLNDQLIKSKAKKAAKTASKAVHKAAVLGAGIMGGGIAYQSASKGVPAVMKDINQQALELGMGEATKLLAKQVERGRLDAVGMAKVIASITPSLSYESVKDVDIVVEAVVENPKIKGAVLKETEALLSDDAILTSNTSTISINSLAENLSRPQNFCGMHFFNPVHRMPLVEVIRGKDTSDETVAAVVAYAAKMGKSPIVVNDCPGFFVNRVLFPYFAGFSKLVLDGADFTQIDKVMEKQFGWPMGPAYLLDVVGLDTAFHCTDVMAAGFPTRMAKLDNDPVAAMYQANRYGQKNGFGFYAYSKDAKGKPKKAVDDASRALLAAICHSTTEFSADEIIARTMVPMINETIRCLEEGIVASAAEADMGLIYGLGFPPFRGGPLRYVDTIGLANFVALADKYAHLGEIYQVTDKTRAMAADGQRFFPV
ncbi:3-hydroxyacyl-CoA dehydrogenase / enoyl-CoA hydratase / 3-hydroxybutyryl-CoA epimerase / enoyl-CoA isomerase [Alkalimonas amylolytica]|uniref:enoyl-CoA hydratase n=2 Tax=Alkalimonas amylolytica TaxID=152573 RepID=A0A1H4D1L3_ALKAM|nr:3-hydroxyacyl-CoA dehydrogenase / enoyl-CoA hydratase / 3-hydroxybutyryl-CoA epimerase / enoyl-CoA isomerase [Alkalimonas amylolytica]